MAFTYLIRLGFQNPRLTVYNFYYQLPFAYCTGQPTCKPIYVWHTHLVIEELRVEWLVEPEWAVPEQLGVAETILQSLALQQRGHVLDVVRGEQGEGEGLWGGAGQGRAGLSL